MLKLLLCILCSAGMAVMVLQMRQQHMNLVYQTNQIHNQIEATQSQLWNQQLDIASFTAPNAIAATVGGHQLDLSAQRLTPRGKPWISPPEATADSSD